jgi:hypothetical protein
VDGGCLKIVNLTYWLAKLITVVILVVVYNLFNFTLDEDIPDYTQHTHRVIYIDREFSQKEKESIALAAITWSHRTKNTVIIDVVFLPSKTHLDRKDGVLINKLSEDDPTVYILGENTLGYYTKMEYIQYIGLISGRIDDDDFDVVVLHELGHALGLEHVRGIDGVGTLMFPSVDLGSDHITNNDIENFCKLYKCDPKKLNN